MAEGPNFRIVGIFSIILLVFFLVIIVMTAMNISEANDALTRYGQDSEMENVKLAQVLLMGISITVLIIFIGTIFYFFTQSKVDKLIAVGVVITFCIIVFFVLVISAISVGYIVNSPNYRGGSTDFNLLIVLSALKLFLSFIFLILGIMLIIYIMVRMNKKPKSLLAIAKGE